MARIRMSSTWMFMFWEGGGVEGEGLLSWSGCGEVTADWVLCWPPCLSPRALGGPWALSASTQHACVGDSLAEGTGGGEQV